MFIEWKYVDHCWPDWAELEIPDDFDGEESVVDYLVNLRKLNIPTWSERFMVERIQWRPLILSPQEIKKRKIKKIKESISFCKRQLKINKNLLKKLESSLLKKLESS